MRQKFTAELWRAFPPRAPHTPTLSLGGQASGRWDFHGEGCPAPSFAQLPSSQSLHLLPHQGSPQAVIIPICTSLKTQRTLCDGVFYPLQHQQDIFSWVSSSSGAVSWTASRHSFINKDGQSSMTLFVRSKTGQEIDRCQPTIPNDHTLIHLVLSCAPRHDILAFNISKYAHLHD